MEYILDWPEPLRTRAVHGGNGIALLTDAPVDNCGRGEHYSPTDLTAVSLASCIMTIIGLQAADRGIDIAGMRCQSEKKMSAQPRRIGRINVDLKIDLGAAGGAVAAEDLDFLREKGRTCPVALSLHQDIDQRVSIKFYSGKSSLESES